MESGQQSDTTDTGGPDLDDVVRAWEAHLFAPTFDWRALVTDVTPKLLGCGPIYELPNPINRPQEDFAIADMRTLDVAEPHYHLNDEHEIYFVLAGTGVVVVGNGITEVRVGDVVITPPLTTHYTIPGKGLVLGVVNTPPFNPTNYIAIRETDEKFGFDAIQFRELTSRHPLP